MKFHSDLKISVFIILLLVGIATFMIGMTMMSNYLKKASGRGVRRLFKKTENNVLANAGIGAATTALIQSSAATSIMTIGFLSAGVMTLFQGSATILGAYLGTTITGVLASFSGFEFSTYLLLLSVIGVVLSFFKKESIKNIGGILCGLGLLFFGLGTMSAVFKSCAQIKDGVSQLCASVSTLGGGPIILWLIGVVLTVLFQSSSATSSIVIVMVGSQTLTFSSGIYLILGATVGTVITTIIASIGGNANVKRVTILAIANRVICSIIGLAIIWPLQNNITNWVNTSISQNNLGICLALFLVIYNIVFLIIWLPILKPIVNLCERLVKDKQNIKQQQAIKYIDNHLLGTPSLAMMQVNKEIIHMYDLSFENYIRGYNAITKSNRNESKIINEVEDSIDYINNFITNFLISLSNRVDTEDEKIIGSYFHIINDIERIGDHASNFLDSAEKMIDKDLSFSDTAKEEFETMNKPIIKMFELTRVALEKQGKVDLQEIHSLEDETDKLKLINSAAHYDRITNKKCHVELSPFYSTFISELERVADHLVNISYAFTNPTGDDENI